MDAQQIFTALIAPAGMTDPYPLYTAMRELGDVVPGPGLVFVAGYEAASAVLRDSSYLVADAEMFDQVSPGWRDHPSLNAESMLNINGDVHARIRALMARQFTHRRVQGLEPAVVRLTDSLLDAMAERAGDGEPVDFMAEFAFALPVAVICELLGVPDTQRDALRSLGRSLTALLEPLYDQAALAEGDRAAVTLAELFGDLVAQRRARPQEDLISQFVAACGADPEPDPAAARRLRDDDEPAGQRAADRADAAGGRRGCQIRRRVGGGVRRGGAQVRCARAGHRPAPARSG
jgi:cytochrome P450